MLADTPFGIAMDAWLTTHPTLALAIWLGTGFIIGILAIKGGESESPVGTLVFMTFGGFPMLVVGGALAVVCAPFFGVVWLLGIKPSHSDTHGV